MAESPPSQIKPMSLRMSLLFFGIPSLVATLGIYVGIPLLNRAGMNLFANFLLFTAGPMAVMLVSALIAYQLEGSTWSWLSIKDRFRLKPLRGTDWLWTLGLLVVYIGGYLLLQPTARWLADSAFLKPPPFLPAVVDPRVMQAGIPTEMMGVTLKGNWSVPLVYALVLAFNIYGEEFWWRGYILPRQEPALGKWTWVVHGLLWNLFHVFWWWNQIALLPQTLRLSFVAFKLKNTTPGIIAHWLNNGLGLVLILLAVLGVGAS